MSSPSFESWKNALESPDINSPDDYYVAIFDIPTAPITILDLGSGSECRFAGWAENRDNDVYSVSPSLLHGEPQLHLERKPLAELKKKLAAIAQCLPFEDEVFDLVVSANAVPAWVAPTDQEAAYSEAIRVLKPGGTAQFYPYAASTGVPGIAEFAARHGATSQIDIIRDPLEMRAPTEIREILRSTLPEAHLARLTLHKTVRKP